MIITAFIKKYILNFYIWWYLIKGREIIMNVLRLWIYVLVYLNVWPMLSNLFVPMFQDRSITGRLVAFPIRLVWGLGGLLIFLVFFVIGLIFLIGYFILPALVWAEVLYYLIFRFLI